MMWLFGYARSAELSVSLTSLYELRVIRAGVMTELSICSQNSRERGYYFRW